MQNAKCVFASFLCVSAVNWDVLILVWRLFVCCLSSPLKVEHFGEIFTSADTDSQHLT